MVDDVGVDGRNDTGSGGVEWLDLGPPERPAHTEPPARRRRRWYVLAATVVAAAILVVSLQHRRDTHAAAAATHPPSHAPSTTVAPAPLRPAPSASTPAQTTVVTDVKHGLLHVPASWELFGRGARSVVRVQLAVGRITVTPVPALDSSGGTSFVVGRDRAIIRPWDHVTGYVVRDTEPAQQLAGVLAGDGPILPGPDRDQVWVPSADGTRMNLVGLDGHRIGVSLAMPEGTGSVNPDGAGYALFYGTGGVYDVQPGRIARITTGDLLADGPTRWLTRECDAAYRCATTVINRATGSKRILPHSFAGSGVAGSIAPDGSFAAVFTVDKSGQPSLGLLDLTTGVTRPLDIPFDPQYSYSSGVCAWSPDSRWLFASGAEGRLKVLDRHTMRLRDLGVSYPVTQVAFRLKD
jgi:hypothetical protein